VAGNIPVKKHKASKSKKKQVIEVSQEDTGVQEGRRVAAAAGRAARSSRRENMHPG